MLKVKEKTELVAQDINIHLPAARPEYKSMLANIQEKAPAIAQASSNFYKSHSQMMSVTLDVTAITPIRSVKPVSYTHLTLPTKRIV